MLSNKDFRVLLVIVDRNRQLVESADFKNIFESFSHGNFIRDDGFVIKTK